MNILARLRVLWNYDPVEMQKAMLREVWALRLFYRPAAKRTLYGAFLDSPSEVLAEIDRMCQICSYDSPYNYRRVQ